MPKKLYLHIGHYKTGTTALQVFLASNQDWLAEHGFEYSRFLLENAKHSLLAFALLREAGAETLMHGYDNPVPPLELWQGLCAHVRASPAQSVIVSSEELMRMGEFPLACARLAEFASLARAQGIAVTVIAYLRNPQDHLRSWHNQLVKMALFPVADFTTALQGGIEAVHYDYGRALAPWIAAFGAEHVIPRDYDAARGDPTGLFRDFLGLLGLSWREGLALPEGDPNPRLDDRILDLLRHAQNAGLPPALITSLRNQALAFLAAQDALASNPAVGLEDVRARSAAGLQALKALPRGNLDLAGLARHLPEGEDPAQAHHSLMTGFLLSEMLLQRRRFNQNLQGLTRRIKALEERLEMQSGGQGEGQSDGQGDGQGGDDDGGGE
jgi:hypothetical protein